MRAVNRLKVPPDYELQGNLDMSLSFMYADYMVIIPSPIQCCFFPMLCDPFVHARCDNWQKIQFNFSF